MWERIRFARESAGLSKAELARRCRVSRTTATQWEGGGSRPIAHPDWASSAGIARATGVALPWLLTGQGEARPPAGKDDVVFTVEQLRVLYELTQLPPEQQDSLTRLIRATYQSLHPQPEPQPPPTDKAKP
jgi:transcriptional regulator with XRE-family HTH domain